MGHVVNPISFRINTNKFTNSTWSSTTKARFSPLFVNDLILTKFINWYLKSFEHVLLQKNLILNNIKTVLCSNLISFNVNFVEINTIKKFRKKPKKKFKFPKKKFKFNKKRRSKKNLLFQTNSLLLFYLNFYKKKIFVKRFYRKNVLKRYIKKNKPFFRTKLNNLCVFLRNYYFNRNLIINFFVKRSKYNIYNSTLICAFLFNNIKKYKRLKKKKKLKNNSSS